MLKKKKKKRTLFQKVYPVLQPECKDCWDAGQTGSPLSNILKITLSSNQLPRIKCNAKVYTITQFFFQILNNAGQIVDLIFWIDGDYLLGCQKQGRNFYEILKVERPVCIRFRRFIQKS